MSRFPLHFKLFYPFIQPGFDEVFKCSVIGEIQYPVEHVFPGFIFARLKLKDIFIGESHLPTAARGKYMWVRLRRSMIPGDYSKKAFDMGTLKHLLATGEMKVVTKTGYAELRAIKVGA